MNCLIWIISFLLIGSKFLDCYTTSTQITSLRQERNPKARKMMELLGIQPAIWIMFGLTILIVGISVWLLFTSLNTTFYKVIFLMLGTVIAWMQLAVAHSNHTKRLNAFTRYLLKRYSRKKTNLNNYN